MPKCPTCGHDDPLLNRNKTNDMLKLADAFYKNLELNAHSYSPGGWGLDDKRPFGNSSVIPDILHIIGIDYDVYEAFSESEKTNASLYANELYLGLGLFLENEWAAYRKLMG
jgi:hypothetical protein